MRGIASAFKTLRLYPPTSPIPRQAAETAADEVMFLLSGRDFAALHVERDGLSFDGVPIPAIVPGTADVADLLRGHGVADVAFTAPCSADDVLAFVSALSREPADLREHGGLGPVLDAAGVGSIQVSDVAILLTAHGAGGAPDLVAASIDTLGVATVDAAHMDAEASAMLRSVANDPNRLAAWVSGVAAEHDALDAGLVQLADATGGAEAFGASLAGAFGHLAPADRDGLIALAVEPGASGQVTRSLTSMLPDDQLAEALATGRSGDNMLALSNALVRLPLGTRLGRVMESVEGLLPQLGHGDKEIRFLEHMVEIRTAAEPATPLTAKEPTLTEIAVEVAAVPGDFSETHAEVASAKAVGSERAIDTMLTLLVQQQDFALYCETLDRVAAMVPGLVADGQLPLAAHVLDDLASRTAASQGAWPGLRERLDAALARATRTETVRALLDQVLEQGEDAIPPARDIMRWGGESAVRSLTEIALASGDGRRFAAAEKLVGRRMLDELCRAAGTVPASGVAAVARRLAVASSEPRCAAALDTLSLRPDVASRRELAAAVARVDTTYALGVAERLLADRDQEVTLAAARGLGQNPSDGASRALAQRLSQLDADGRDFPLAREIVLSLARHEDPIAVGALDRLAARRQLIKRGNFTALQEVVRQAQQMQRRS